MYLISGAFLSNTPNTRIVIRRVRFDMIQTYKILRGFDNVDYKTWFTKVNNNNTRLSSFHLNPQPSRSNHEIRRHFFGQRVVNTWNTLPNYVKDSVPTQVHSSLTTINICYLQHEINDNNDLLQYSYMEFLWRTHQ